MLESGLLERGPSGRKRLTENTSWILSASIQRDTSGNNISMHKLSPEAGSGIRTDLVDIPGMPALFRREMKER